MHNLKLKVIKLLCVLRKKLLSYLFFSYICKNKTQLHLTYE